MKAKEITPTEARCGVGPCPAVFKTDRNTLIIIGSVPAGSELPRNIRRKMGKGETAIEVPANVLPPSPK
ncbi:MAG: hypothetical protein WC250_00140 [Candidatus Paceibacterota bacterium]|jgi:hypothetical protein